MGQEDGLTETTTDDAIESDIAAEPEAPDRLPGRIHIRPRKHLDTDVWTKACERTADLMTDYDKVFVSFSGGKDSTAALQTALYVAHSDPKFERHLPMRAVFYDEEAIPYETEEYVRRVAQRDDVTLEWYCLPTRQRNACSRKHPWWWNWAPEDEALWCRPLPPEAITELAGFPIWPREARYAIPMMNGLLADPADGNTVQIMGIRAQESLIRNGAVSRRSIDNYIVADTCLTAQKGGLWKAYPVYDWTVQDVWTAPAKFGWDYNRAYDRQEMAGWSAARQRCSPAFAEEPLMQFHIWAQCFPEIWEKMCDRVPGVGAAWRYSRTELYAQGSRPQKPEGMTYPEFMLHYLAKFEPAVVAQISNRMGNLIRQHYRKTTHPILPHAFHPETGCDWDFFLGLAMRGDFKERRQPSSRSSLDELGRRPAKDWLKYAAELQRCLDEGITPDELGYPRPLPADPLALLPDYVRDEAT